MVQGQSFRSSSEIGRMRERRGGAWGGVGGRGGAWFGRSFGADAPPSMPRSNEPNGIHQALRESRLTGRNDPDPVTSRLA